MAALITVGAAVAAAWIAPTATASAAAASPHRAPTAAAARRSASEAAAAIDEITSTRRTSANPLAEIPPDFATVMGYRPALGRLANGDVVAINPHGGCSVIGGGAPFDLSTVCKAHDLGYDLLRYAHRRGHELNASYRMRVDTKFADDLNAQCASDYRGPTTSACDAMAGTFVAGVGFNSWRQQYGPPIRSSGTVRTIGVLAFAALLLFFVGRAAMLTVSRRWRRRTPRATLASGARL